MALAALAVCSLPAGGCRPEPPGQVTVVVGPAAEQRVVFPITAALAEYIELPGDRNELRLTLASYDASCDRYVPPEDDEAVVLVTVLTPPNEAPALGTYPFDAPFPTEGPVETALAVPKVQLGRQSHSFEPGGTLRLTAVQLGVHDTISGLLDFHFRGETDRPATRLEGSFSAMVCRHNAAPER